MNEKKSCAISRRSFLPWALPAFWPLAAGIPLLHRAAAQRLRRKAK